MVDSITNGADEVVALVLDRGRWDQSTANLDVSGFRGRNIGVVAIPVARKLR